MGEESSARTGRAPAQGQPGRGVLPALERSWATRPSSRRCSRN